MGWLLSFVLFARSDDGMFCKTMSRFLGKGMVPNTIGHNGLPTPRRDDGY
jgi:hypothetical protein